MGKKAHVIRICSHSDVGKMRNCGMQKVTCGMETMERCSGTVGEMRNVEMGLV